MKCNVGNTDRMLRIVVGLVIIGTGVFYQNWLGVIGIIPIVTALVRFCPAYSIIGFSSDK